MALNALGLGFVFTAKDLATGTIQRLNGQLNTMGATAGRTGTRVRAGMAVAGAGIALLVGGLATLGTAVKLAGAAGEFEFEMARVGAISRATAADMGVLNEAAKEAGLLTQFSPKEAAEGLGAFALQGFNAKESAKALKPALDFAAGGMVSVKQGAETMTAAMKVFGIETDNAGIAADKLLKISNITALEAGDLKVALGNVSRGAVAAKQSIDEMLPSIGLVKNTGVDASVAGTAVSSALDFMTKNAKKIKKEFGVDIADANGNVRDFMDIVLDLEKAGQKFGTAERLAKLTKTVGRFGKTAVVAIGSQLSKGIRDSEGRILKGADAIEFLRSQMRNAAGTAKEFRDRLLDTFEGQKILLKGSLQTLAISLGEPLAAALKPLVSGVITAVNTVIKFIESIPAPIKKTIGKLILVFGGLLTGGGVIALFIAAGTLMIGMLKAMAIGAAIALAVVAALSAVIGAGVLIFKGYERATVGVVDKTNSLTRAWDKLKLGFTAVMALISGNPVSKEVVDDLKKAENQGVFNFVQSVGRLIIRVRRFIGGLSAGFNSLWIGAKPVFDALFDAFSDFGDALGFGGEAFNDFAGAPANKFIAAGFKIGRIVAIVIKGLVRGFTFVVNVITGVINGVKAAFNFFGPIIDVLVVSFKALFQEIGKAFEELGLMSGGMDESGGVAQMLGKVIGFVAAAIRLAVVPAIILFVNMIRFGVAVFRVVIGVFKKGADFLRENWDSISDFFQNEIVGRFEKWGQALVEFVQPVIDIFNDLVEIINTVLSKIDEVLNITGKAEEVAEDVANFFGLTTEEAPAALSLASGEDTATGLEGRSFEVGSAGSAAAAKAATDPEAIAAGVRIQARLGQTPSESLSRAREVAKGFGLDDASLNKLGNAVSEALKRNPPSINVDGAELGAASMRGSTDNDAREFRQVPVEG